VGEALVEPSQLVVVRGAHVPRLGPLHCDAELGRLLPCALLAAELEHASMAATRVSIAVNACW